MEKVSTLPFCWAVRINKAGLVSFVSYSAIGGKREFRTHWQEIAMMVNLC